MRALAHHRAQTAYAGAFLALLLCAVAPVWLVTVPQLGDYPNHLARMHILLNASESGPLSEFYQVRWSVIPNLAMDLIVPALAHLVPLEMAGKIFVSLTLVLLSTGVLALNYVLHRRLSVWPFAVFLLLFNGIFLYGILNFLFGLGLALWALAAWMHVAESRGWQKALLFHAACALLFVAHMSALGVFASSVLIYELQRWWIERAAVRWPDAAAWIALLALGPVLLVLLLLLSPSEAAATQPAFGYSEPFWFTVLQKLCAPLLFFRNYVTVLDLLTLALAVWVILYGVMTRSLTMDRRISASLAALVLMFLVMPFQIFGANFADVRILLAAAFLFVAASSLQASPKVHRMFAVGLVVLFGVRMGVLLDRWERSDVVQAQYQQAIEHVPEGARPRGPGIRPTRSRRPLRISRRSRSSKSRYSCPPCTRCREDSRSPSLQSTWLSHVTRRSSNTGSAPAPPGRS